MGDCIFCKIVKGEIPSSQVYADDKIIVFKDLSPMAPVHLLAIPREHIASAAEITDGRVVGHIFEIIAANRKLWGLGEGFRVITNSGKPAGQTVDHLHFHILGGRDLGIELG